jgi:hypothetical protein
MTWKVRWNAPSLPTAKSPLEIVIERAKSPPGRVRIEVWESDAKKVEVDNYSAKKDLGDDDKVATFVGTLAAHPDRPEGVLFTDEDGKAEFTAQQGSDHVFIRFEGMAADKQFEVPIPRSAEEPAENGPTERTGDGEFYELFFRVFEEKGTSPLAESKVTFVRRRTDVLLAVEPLNQADASLSGPLAERIFEHFYGGSKSTANRNWGDVVVRCINGGPVTFGSSGCSYTVLAMCMRYLRVRKSGGESLPPGDPAAWETLYEKHVKDLKDEYKPFKAVDLVPKAKEIDALAKKVAKEQGWGSAKAMNPESYEDCDASDGLPRPGDLAVSLPDHWYPPHVAWWVRQLDETTLDVDKYRRGQMRWAKNEKGADAALDMIDAKGSPLYKYRFKETHNGQGHADVEEALVFPGIAKCWTAAGIQLTSHNISHAWGADWQKFVKTALDRGLPVIAHFKSGRYLPDGVEPGGHYTVIVGYRTVEGKLRFIINDSAGAAKLQYECHFMDELTPTPSMQDVLESAKVGAALLTTGKKGTVLGEASGGTLSAPFTESAQLELSDDLGGKYQVTITVAPESWDGSKFLLNAVRVKAIVTRGGTAVTSFEKVVECEDRKGTFTAKASASGVFVETRSDGVTARTLSVVVGLRLAGTRKVAKEARKVWECHNVLVERRRKDSLFALHRVEPKGWETGAALHIKFDGAKEPE